MIQNILKYSILFGIIFGVVSCDKLIYDNLEEKPDGKEAKVFLAVTRSAHTDGNESINKDEIDFEDRVHDMAMFVFDNVTGNLVGEPYFESNIPITDKSKTFIVELTPGQRDFYFVANMPKTELEEITSRSALEDYMKLTKNLDEDLYLSASETKGFPMSRVYPNQTITMGGTIYNPKPFRPNSEDKVKLQRVVAQLQVDFDPTEIDLVKNVYYKNAFRKFSLLADGVITSPEYYLETATNNALRKSGNSYIYNMPEALMTNPVWTATEHKPINYFVIETMNDITYEIPIITHEGTIADGNYLKFARGEQAQKPEYAIYRNRRYVYEIKNLQQDIEIDYVVDPWTLVQSSFYMGYGYNVGVDEDGNVTISNTVLACDPHKVTLKTKTGFTFDGGGTEKEFANADSDASVTYKVTPIPNLGEEYLEVYYNDKLVKTFTK